MYNPMRLATVSRALTGRRHQHLASEIAPTQEDYSNNRKKNSATTVTTGRGGHTRISAYKCPQHPPLQCDCAHRARIAKHHNPQSQPPKSKVMRLSVDSPRRSPIRRYAGGVSGGVGVRALPGCTNAVDVVCFCSAASAGAGVNGSPACSVALARGAADDDEPGVATG